MAEYITREERRRRESRERQRIRDIVRMEFRERREVKVEGVVQGHVVPPPFPKFRPHSIILFNIILSYYYYQILSYSIIKPSKVNSAVNG